MVTIVSITCWNIKKYVLFPQNSNEYFCGKIFIIDSNYPPSITKRSVLKMKAVFISYAAETDFYMQCTSMSVFKGMGYWIKILCGFVGGERPFS